jgi:hypothetical protein
MNFVHNYGVHENTLLHHLPCEFMRETVFKCVSNVAIFSRSVIWFISSYFTCIYVQVSNNKVRLSEMDGELYNWAKEKRKHLFMKCFHKKLTEI